MNEQFKFMCMSNDFQQGIDYVSNLCVEIHSGKVIKNTWTAASYASDYFMHLCIPKCVKPAILNITQGYVALSELNM